MLAIALKSGPTTYGVDGRQFVGVLRGRVDAAASVEYDGKQAGALQVGRDRRNFRELCRVLDEHHLTARVLEHPGARLRVVRGVDSDGDAAREDARHVRDEPLGRIEAEHTDAANRLEPDRQDRLGHFHHLQIILAISPLAHAAVAVHVCSSKRVVSVLVR